MILNMKDNENGVVILASGGIDSFALILKAISENRKTVALMFDYGQGVIKKEKEAFKNFLSLVDKNLKIELKTSKIDFGYTSKFIRGNLEGLTTCWVPLRNAIFAMVGCSYAISRKIPVVWLGSTREDVYPDNDKKFGKLFNPLVLYASYGEVLLVQPFVNIKKSTFIRKYCDFPLHLSWSCYKTGKYHCGTCKSCLQRKEAFKDSKILDKTRYLN